MIARRRRKSNSNRLGVLVLITATFYFLSLLISDASSISRDEPVSVLDKPIGATPIPKQTLRTVRRPRFNSQSNEDKALYEMIYKDKAPEYGGVILEMGALDGVTFSISMFFEKFLGWKSILIEANPKNFKKLVVNRPKSINIYSAVCAGDSISFIGDSAVGGAKEFMKEGHKKRWIKNNAEVSVPCTTFGSIFDKHHIHGIDVFVLDVEGGELEALEVMDWTVPVGIFVIELSGGPKDEQVRKLLYRNGYIATNWNIRDFCNKGGDCSDNECFVKK